MWLYSQSTGKYFAPNGVALARGYSGHGDGKNNPTMQAVKGVGPIPCGLWRMTDLELTGGPTPYTVILAPEPGTETFGRTDFRLHGDMIDPQLAGTASHGCIILPRFARERSWESTDHVLSVVP